MEKETIKVYTCDAYLTMIREEVKNAQCKRNANKIARRTTCKYRRIIASVTQTTPQRRDDGNGDDDENNDDDDNDGASTRSRYQFHASTSTIKYNLKKKKKEHLILHLIISRYVINVQL
ncbi:hypothetical protein PUN28_017677 [Cardiocondyla obscurior]|uniref:Uncharacterized protein n=1 Tax=Cardiocondyla obscurior TaxID=286306 RepID=A0AAW2EIL6_9HYME